MRIRFFEEAWILSVLLFSLAACTGPPTEVATEPAEPTAVAPTSAPEPTLTPLPTPSPVPSATPLVEPQAGRIFTYYGVDPSIPVVPKGVEGRWDGKYINPGGVLYHDGAFHMFRNGFTNWPGLVSVGYMTSSDGLEWTSPQNQPVFTSDQVPYVEDGQGADVSSVMVLEDGTWVMYFHRVSRSNPAVIGRATAPSPLGPWEVDPEPVLTPGSAGAWDAFGLSWPSVVQTADGLAMYYTGAVSAFGETRIGMATSRDGLVWTKYDDPATRETLYAESDPVFSSLESWTNGAVDRARIQPGEDGWVMIYQGGPLIHRGLAFSKDGVHWTVHPDNPVLTSEDFPLSGSMWDTALVSHDGIYYYYTEIGSLAATNIYLAIHEGPLAPLDLADPVASGPLPDGVQVLHLDDLLAQDAPASPDYTGTLSSGDLSLGVYAMGPGAVDNQPSHGEDEIYYVVEGEAVLEVDGEAVPAPEGAFLYVRAGVPHRFTDVTAGLQTLVYFSKAVEDPGDPPWLAFQLAELAPGADAFLDVATMSARLIDFGPGELQAVPMAGGSDVVFLVVSGNGLAAVGEGAALVRAGSLILVPADLDVSFSAVGDDPIRILVFEATP